MTAPSDLVDLRPEDGIDQARLLPHLRERLPHSDGPFQMFRFVGGHANLTYLLRFGEVEYVLRRPPHGPVPPGTHDMRREHRVLQGLHREYPLAPRSYLLCEDESLIGGVFIVLERRRGIVIRDSMPRRFSGDPDLNRRLGEMIIDSLADLHRTDPKTAGFESVAEGASFRERQLAGWTRRWAAAESESYPSARTILAYLESQLPPTMPVSLLHNDYKLDNFLLDSQDPARAVAVLDWDMCSVGDPLLDLGYLMNYWNEPQDPPEWRMAATMPTFMEGFPRRDEAIARYARRTGMPVSSLQWYRVFAAFKLAVILQQIYVRYLRGQTTDSRFAGFGARILALLDKAETLISTEGMA